MWGGSGGCARPGVTERLRGLLLMAGDTTAAAR